MSSRRPPPIHADPHSIEKTPSKISRTADKIIDELNANYDLDLPRLTGKAAQEAEAESRKLQLQCSERIRYLCSKPLSNLQGALEDFDEQARSALSNWVPKPRQERGTIPRNVTKSFISRDPLSRPNGKLSDEQRQSLISMLAGSLSEEYKLCRESDVYERISSPSLSRPEAPQVSVSRSHSSLSSDGRLFRTPAQSPAPAARSSFEQHGSPAQGQQSTSSTSSGSPRKRGRSTKNHQTTIKKQRKITDIFVSKSTSAIYTPAAAPLTCDNPEHSFDGATELAHAISFETVATENTEDVFSEVEDNGIISANTSLMSSMKQLSQDYFPTQEVEDIMNDISFVSNLDQIEQGQSAEIRMPDGDSERIAPRSLYDLAQDGPFTRIIRLPRDMPYWQKFELQRLSLAAGVDELTIHKKVLERQRSTASTFQQSFKNVASALRLTSVFGSSTIPDWISLSEHYKGTDSRKSAYFSGKLEFAGQKSKDIFRFTLDPIQTDRSCRFHRHYGADRFLTLYVPYFTLDRLPTHIKSRFRTQKANVVHEVVMKWLSTTEHYIAGRSWRAFLVEPDKSRSKKMQKEHGQQQKISLFAVDGEDFESMRGAGEQRGPITLEEFVDWHLPLQANALDDKQTDLKAFSRFRLGLSKTVPTVEIFSSEIYETDEPHGGAPDMSDGCAMMSIGLARTIWRECGDGTSNVPSAFQGRFSGAKGLWIVDYHDTRYPSGERGIWIEVAASQLKIQPHPRRRNHTDVHLRTFEVLEYSKPCTSGSLNLQLITILEHGGVSRAVLKTALQRQAEEYFQAAENAFSDPVQLRGWVQQYHSFRRIEHSASSGLPSSLEAEICLLLESGFCTEYCPRLRDALRKLITMELDSYVEKLRIPLQHSTNVFCATDPYGVLAPHEVHLGFSTDWSHPVTGLPESCLDNIDVLLARNPAHLPSDIQKRRAVHKRELRHFKNIILFPRTGTEPLASLLSGGDYDGDTVAVIWDPSITGQFHNTSKPDLPTEAQCGMERKSRKLSEVFQSRYGRVKICKGDMDAFLEHCFSFNAYPNLLGICTYQFERLVYNGLPLSDPRAIKLAALAGHLVDCAKAGWFLSDIQWAAILREVAQGVSNHEVCYRSKNGEQARRDGSQCMNIIDFLKFDVAQEQKETKLVIFRDLFAEASDYDITLAKPYKALQLQIQSSEVSNTQRKAMASMMADLKSKLEYLRAEWASKTGGSKDQNNFPAILEDFTRRLEDIKPKDVDCDLTRAFTAEGHALGSRWSLLRASTFYALFHNRSSNLVWSIVGGELCRIKARTSGDTLEILSIMHNVLKADVSRIAKLGSQRQNIDFEDAEDIFLDAEE